MPGASIRSADEITPHADFASLGLNSVDILEFVINFETEFHLDVPDEVLANPSMRSLHAWVEYLSKQQANAA
ncbi:MAG: phosphopantetheine-binding protein [Archangium sp.]